MKEANAQILSR